MARRFHLRWLAPLVTLALCGCSGGSDADGGSGGGVTAPSSDASGGAPGATGGAESRGGQGMEDEGPPLDPEADPCDERFVNCADDCDYGGRYDKCVEPKRFPYQCTSKSFAVQDGVGLRVPPAGELQCLASEADDCFSPRLEVYIYESPPPFRLRIADDWRILTTGEGVNPTCPDSEPRTCLVSDQIHVVLAPMHPDAKARNLLIEEVEEGATCD